MEMSGLSRPAIQKLINEGLIESYIYKHRPEAESGSRMINLLSLNEYLERRAQEAKAGKMVAAAHGEVSR